MRVPYGLIAVLLLIPFSATQQPVLAADPSFSGSYLTVTAVLPGGSADDAGILPGDLLLMVSSIVPRSPTHADSLIGFGACELSLMRGDSIIETSLRTGFHGLTTAGPEAEVSSQSVFLEGLDPSPFMMGKDARAAGWTAICAFLGSPVPYETIVLASGAAFWSEWYRPAASITAARSDASWFDRKMASAGGIPAVTTGTLTRCVAVARNSVSAGYPAIATGFGRHGTVLVTGYQLYGDTLYGYDRFGRVVSAVSCSTVVAVSSVGPPPGPGLALGSALPFARTIMYMTSWRPALFDELRRPASDEYAVGEECFPSWIAWLESDSFPSPGSPAFSEGSRTCHRVAETIGERRAIASAFLDSLSSTSLDLSGLEVASSAYLQVSELMDSLAGPGMLDRLATESGRSLWVSVLRRVGDLESRAMDSIMASP
ncbi:hypothetical protein JW921_04795 [Candidatus Fermentibacterales bacterium]|nr:hypothetical protein [Candidatus Fermentibacterales bacterium]